MASWNEGGVQQKSIFDNKGVRGVSQKVIFEYKEERVHTFIKSMK